MLFPNLLVETFLPNFLNSIVFVLRNPPPLSCFLNLPTPDFLFLQLIQRYMYIVWMIYMYTYMNYISRLLSLILLYTFRMSKVNKLSLKRLPFLYWYKLCIYFQFPSTHRHRELKAQCYCCDCTYFAIFLIVFNDTKYCHI